MGDKYITSTPSIYEALDKGLNAQIAVMDMLDKNPNLRSDIRSELIRANTVNAALSNEILKLVMTARQEHEHE